MASQQHRRLVPDLSYANISATSSRSLRTRFNDHEDLACYLEHMIDFLSTHEQFEFAVVSDDEADVYIAENFLLVADRKRGLLEAWRPIRMERPSEINLVLEQLMMAKAFEDECKNMWSSIAREHRDRD